MSTLAYPRAAPRPLLLAAALAGLTLAAGCATGPNPALESARATVRSAQGDPVIQRHAPLAVREAEQALERAERANRQGAGGDEIAHLAYLAEQRAVIAQAQAVERESQAEIEELGGQRERILLEARTEQVRELQERLSELQARQTERGLVVTLGSGVLFDVNRAEIRPGAQDQLRRLAEVIRESPDRRVLIEGHTDSTGDAAYNMALSERRAEAVRNFLVLNGVPRERIRAGGFGETRPVASNDTAAGRQQNRRVEVVILEEGEPFPGVASR